LKRDSGTGQHPMVHRRARGGVHSGSGDQPSLGCSRPSPGGHRLRGGGATGQGVAVPPLGQHSTASSRPPAGHRHRGGGATGQGVAVPQG
jgi:hypothetical protein